MKSVRRPVIRNTRALILCTATLFSVLVPLPAHATVQEECTITGTGKSETILGTSGDDVICGLGGNDIIRGGGGDDVIYGGTGNDKISGGKGEDELFGGTGNDTAEGGTGTDLINGEAGNDVLLGGPADDVLLGEDGRDSLSAGDGNDALSGGAGSDSIRSGSGVDNCSLDNSDRQWDDCAVDQLAPTVVFQNQNLEFDAGTTAVFRWTAEDVSGVWLGSVWIGGAPGWVDWCGFGELATLVDGSVKSGTYEFQCLIPDNAVNGEYGIYIHAVDPLGNFSSHYQVFTVVNGSSDNRVPEISDIRLPGSVKVGDTFTVEFDATDETGTDLIYAWFSTSAPYFYGDENGLFISSNDTASLVGGTPTSGTWVQTLTVASWAPPGEYSLLVSVRDTPGNRSFFPSGFSIVVTE